MTGDTVNANSKYRIMGRPWLKRVLKRLCEIEWSKEEMVAIEGVGEIPRREYERLFVYSNPNTFRGTYTQHRKRRIAKLRNKLKEALSKEFTDIIEKVVEEHNADFSKGLVENEITFIRPLISNNYETNQLEVSGNMGLRDKTNKRTFKDMNKVTINHNSFLRLQYVKDADDNNKIHVVKSLTLDVHHTTTSTRVYKVSTNWVLFDRKKAKQNFNGEFIYSSSKEEDVLIVEDVESAIHIAADSIEKARVAVESKIANKVLDKL